MIGINNVGMIGINNVGKEWTSPDLMTFISAGMEGERSEKELREKSYRTLTGKKEKASTGRWMGGQVPYGIDVVCLHTETGKEKWRVQIQGRDIRVKIQPDGQRIQYNGQENFPATDSGHHLELRPTTETERLNGVREIFERFNSEAISVTALARWLNDTKVPANYSDRWEHYHVRELLKNPIYIGVYAWGKSSQGSYGEIRDGQYVSVSPGRKQVRRPRKEWVTSCKVFEPPIVDQKLFDAVQKKFELQPAARRAPKAPDLWFAGLVFCGTCGKRMRGYFRKADKSIATPYGEYICATYAKHGKEPECKCLRNSIAHAEVERHVAKYLAQSGQRLADFERVYRTGEMAGLKRHERDFMNSLQHMVEAHIRMLSEAGTAFATTVRNGSGFGLDTLEAVYRDIFGAKRSEHQKRFAELDAEHDAITDQVLKLPESSRAFRKARLRLNALEIEMDKVEALMKNAADEYNANRQTVLAIHQNFAAAFDAVNSPKVANRQRQRRLGRLSARSY